MLSMAKADRNLSRGVMPVPVVKGTNKQMPIRRQIQIENEVLSR